MYVYGDDDDRIVTDIIIIIYYYMTIGSINDEIFLKLLRVKE